MILGKTPFQEPDPYEVLEIGRESDRREVNRVYRERMRGLSMQDPRFQEVQRAKETLTKPRKRARADLLHTPAHPWLEDLRRRFRDQRLDLELADVAGIALAVSDVTHPEDLDLLENFPPMKVRFQLSAALTADPVRARLEEVGP